MPRAHLSRRAVLRPIASATPTAVTASPAPTPAPAPTTADKGKSNVSGKGRPSRDDGITVISLPDRNAGKDSRALGATLALLRQNGKDVAFDVADGPRYVRATRLLSIANNIISNEQPGKEVVLNVTSTRMAPMIPGSKEGEANEIPTPSLGGKRICLTMAVSIRDAPKAPASQPDTVRVGSKSDPVKVAGAIAARIKQGGAGSTVSVTAAGAAPIAVMFASVGAARLRTWAEGLDIDIVPMPLTLDADTAPAASAAAASQQQGASEPKVGKAAGVVLTLRAFKSVMPARSSKPKGVRADGDKKTATAAVGGAALAAAGDAKAGGKQQKQQAGKKEGDASKSAVKAAGSSDKQEGSS